MSMRRLLTQAILSVCALTWCLSAQESHAADSYKNVTFDDIKLDLKKDEKFKRSQHLTDKVEELDGAKIRIRGWIHPSVFTQTGIKQFVLVRDNQECCFGPGAALHDCIWVQMEDGASTNFTTRPIAVEGVFRVEEVPGPGGAQMAIYQLKGVSAK
jgi:hypothetical protein